jgi:hypothetical protein
MRTDGVLRLDESAVTKGQHERKRAESRANDDYVKHGGPLGKPIP